LAAFHYLVQFRRLEHSSKLKQDALVVGPHHLPPNERDRRAAVAQEFVVELLPDREAPLLNLSLGMDRPNKNVTLTLP
jgi:hypothetical protein